MHIKIFNKQQGVSPVIATIIMIGVVVGILVSALVIMNSSYSSKLSDDGFWSTLYKQGIIQVELACPCDMLIVNSAGKKLGYQNGDLCREIKNAKLESDDGEKEQYEIKTTSDDVNNILYHVVCTDDGDYNLNIKYSTSQQTLSVTANEISITKDVVHEYKVTWGNPPTISLRIDSKGDGDFKQGFVEKTGVITNQIINDAEGDDDDDVGGEVKTDQLSLTLEITDITKVTLTRCITINLNNCAGSSEIIKQEITFTNGIGNALIDVTDGKEYTCISVKDILHTLRKTDSSLTKEGNLYIAEFTGEDALISGDLNNDNYIDILDYGVYSWQFGKEYPGDGDTVCSTPYPHADLNGDGIVNAQDFMIVQSNFLKASDLECCT